MIEENHLLYHTIYSPIRKHLATWVTFAILFLTVFQLYAQSPKFGLPEIEFYDRSQYGAESQNWNIAQDNCGVMFFANNAGLLAYDGTHWKLDKRKFVGGIKSLSFIDNKLYVGNSNELGFMRYDSLQHLVYEPITGNDELKYLDYYWRTLKYQDQVVNFTEKAIVFLRNDKVVEIVHTKSRFMGIYNVNGKLLFHDKESGLLEYHNGKVTPLIGGEIFANKPVGAILPFSPTQFVIATLTDGLYLGDATGIKKWNVDANPHLEKASVFCGISYQDEYFVLGTLQKGVFIINKRGEIVTQIDKDKGLKNNLVLSLFVDNEENIWCGLENGIAKIKINSSITFLGDYFNLGTGYTIGRFNDYYYLGTAQGLYKISDQKLRDPLKERADFVQIAGSVSQHLSLYSDGKELLCGSNYGVLRVEGNSAKLITPITVNGCWCFKEFIDNPNKLIVGTYDGLVLLEKKGGQWQFNTKINGFAESGRFIEWESSSTLLVAHSFKGVYRLHFNSICTEVASIDTLAFEDFPGNKSDLTLSKIGGKCLFSSFYGIYLLKEGSNKPERFTNYDSYFTNDRFPQSLKEDEFGNIWFVFPDEVGVLRKLEDGSFKRISYPFLPLKSKIVNSFQSSFVIDKENVFFNTDDGFAHYSVNDKINRQQPFNVHITSFVGLNDSTVYSLYKSNNSEVLKSVVPHFKYNNNSFEVEYAATFFNDKNMLYSTFLNGVDEGQLGWSKKSSRSFSALKEGVYELTVYAKNSYDVQSSSAIFRFIVDPPWYRSFLAKSIYLTLLVLFVFVGVQQFKRYIFNVKNEVSEEHTIRFKAKEDQLIYDSLVKEQAVTKLRNEQLHAEMLFKERELANLTVHVVKKNDFLSDLKEQLRRVITIKEASEYARKISNIIKKIDSDIENENNWTAFERQFELVHASFLSHLLAKHPTLNVREQKLCAFIKMGLSSKEIASLMNITTQAVENNRSKLRQGLGLSATDNLAKYLGSM